MGFKQKLKRGVRSLIMLTKEEKLYPIPQPINAQRISEGKIALITGGSGGIGMAKARTFWKAGVGLSSAAQVKIN